MNYRAGKEERKLNVLRHIIDTYVSTALPVGSRIVAGRMGDDVSSATVRNIMGELEEEGFITQPHTSAGRVPTQSGYRCYVDSIKDRIKLEKKEARKLAGEYGQRMGTLKEIIERTSFLIASELRGAGVVMWPGVEDFYLKHIELIKVKAQTILAVLVTVTNAVKNYIIQLEEELEKGQLERVSNYINANYEFSTVAHISGDLRHMLSVESEKEDSEFLKTARVALGVIDTIIDNNIENEIYWEGLDHFLEELALADIGIARQIIQTFAERKSLIQFMRRELPYRGLRVYIGRENSCKMLTECSTVTCGYTLFGRTVGRIGVIGSTRMNYSNALSTISHIADLVSAKLEHME